MVDVDQAALAETLAVDGSIRVGGDYLEAEGGEGLDGGVVERVEGVLED